VRSRRPGRGACGGVRRFFLEIAAVGGGSGESLRREKERRGWREEEMDATGEGGEARDLGGAGSSVGTDGVDDGVCGAKGEEESRVGGAGGANSQRGQNHGGEAHLCTRFFLHFVLFRSRDKNDAI
jgi:hypothetical protein